MPLQSETFDLADEQARLQEEMEDVADRLDAARDSDGSEDVIQTLLERGLQKETYREGLEWARESWDVDEITLSGLTSGDLKRVEDTLDDGVVVSEQQATVAVGTAEAPYLQHDPESFDQDDFEDTIVAVADCAPAFVGWAEMRITELSRLEAEEGNGFVDLLRDRQAGE